MSGFTLILQSCEMIPIILQKRPQMMLNHQYHVRLIRGVYDNRNCQASKGLILVRLQTALAQFPSMRRDDL